MNVKIESVMQIKLVFIIVIVTMIFGINMVLVNNRVYADSPKTLYVSPSGNDKNNGSKNSPFKTIQAGLDALNPGDTLLIRGGVYKETTDIFNRQGSQDAWFTVENYPGESVTMEGDYRLNWGGKIAPDAITFRNSSYWKVQGIKMAEYTGAGIYLTDKSNHVEMSNLTICDLDYPVYRPYGTSGIDGENSNDCTVKNCSIYSIGLKVNKPKDHGIYIGYQANNWIFDGNDIHDNAGAAIQLYGAPNGGSNCKITNNRLYDNHAYGLAIGSNAQNNYIYNNVFYGNNWCDVFMLESSTKNYFKGNLFLTGYSNYNVQLTDEGSVDNSFDYNTYYKINGVVVNRYDQMLNFNQWRSYGEEDSGELLQNYDEAQEKIASWKPAEVKNYTSRRLSGIDRFQTAEAIAEEFNSSKIDSVVITSGYSFNNALSGSVLAKKLDAPILLSGKTYTENQSAVQYINRHMNTSGKIYILGDEGNINENIITGLKNLGYNNIEILQDGEKYGAVKSINDKINASKGTPIVVLSGNDFPDGLSISAVAAAKGYPVIYSDLYDIPSESKETIKKINPSQIYIIGGNGVVSDYAKDNIKILTGLSDDKIVRIGGSDRYETSINVAKYFKMDGDIITLASGKDFPDALAGSVLSAKLNAPLILLGDNNKIQKDFVDTGKFTTQIIYGGTASISEYIAGSMAK
ncbi:cell wall-binding protein [Clostridium fermenticellae]|uniref:Cell wall-binding protein n=1 Tax=Clostridium fermenticellae TaxID=2068654 RepID=A0A386H278_9CLOT|nr:cell wall-binding repeat-containing protein [Clostridium fermenticellae]AYD39807.1 cell wall-binding protein [Clostridium fermenticellae]